MNYDIAPKPTVYKGIQFRSRLEARWAAFFDLTEWRWEYEPCEINGYNPDFIIYCTSEGYDTKSIIVEVKPSIFVDTKYEDAFIKKYEGAAAHLLLLTENPFYLSENGNVSIGQGCQFNICDDVGYHTELVDLEMKCEDDFGSAYQQYDGMIYGEESRKRFIDFDYSEYDTIKERWIEAGNEVQFMKPNKRR
jgi:hypothetical protein